MMFKGLMFKGLMFMGLWVYGLRVDVGCWGIDFDASSMLFDGWVRLIFNGGVFASTLCS